MPLTLGTRLGPYEILSALGSGGMGEVYRARDTKLNRDVALKVIPETFALDPDRVARFTREAQVLATLNHPHIAAIYGFEDSGKTHALVLELVEGETLADRITRGPIPLEEVLPIARQICEALEAAHEPGIIHRDLKPANIKITPEGAVKVLDFGLAKLTDPAHAPASNVSWSPTITSPAMMTGVGMILGTAAYMSPEQAKGRPADKRSDLWAFGCVLYEMLTGSRPFDGEDVTDVMVAVLSKEPDWRALPAVLPTPITRLLHRSLEKDRKRRLDSAAAARLEIDEAIAAPASDEAVAPAAVLAPRWRRPLPWVVAVVALIAGVTMLLVWAPWRPLPPSAPLRLSVELGADASLVIALGGPGVPAGSATVVSPDGSQLAFVAQAHDGGTRLYIRRLDQLTATPLQGTEGAVGPFFSPNGQWLGFFSAGKLQKVAVTGGGPVKLADAPSSRGGSWADDGTIVFAPATGSGGGLWRVPAAGGTAERLTTPARGEATHRWPQVLPGGRAVLYTVSAVTGNSTNAWLAVQPLPTGTPHVVQSVGSYGRYLPSGHLTWVHDGTLFAAPFDLATLAVTGPDVPVVPGVVSSNTNGSAQVEVSHTGTLVYVPGSDAAFAAPLDWLTRDGKTTPLRSTPANWSGVQIAPGGRRLALSITDASNQDVWTYEAARDQLTRITFGSGMSRNPVWTPDGQRLVYASAGTRGAQNLFWRRADGSGAETLLTTSPNAQIPGSWDPRDPFLAFQENRPQTSNDVLILRFEGDEASGWKPGMPTVFLGEPYAEQQPRFSPDGRWLAYESNESGAFEIYVRPFPGPGGAKAQISTAGGTNAVWSSRNHELLYLAPDGRIMVVPYAAAGEAFHAERPRVWSETPIQVRQLIAASFDLDPDGQRVAMAPRPAGAAGPTHVTLMFNFFDELRRVAPVN